MSQEVNFDSLNLPIPQPFKRYSIEKQREVFEYLNEMNELDKIAYKIAFNHLQSSFDICRSNGFKQWKNKPK